MKLHDIADDHRGLIALAEKESLSTEDIADTLDGIEGMFEHKAQSIFAITSDIDDDILVLDAHIIALQDKKKALVNKQKSWREYLRINMEKTGITNIKCPLFSITLAKGRDILVIDKAEEIPVEYVDTQVIETPDKRRILADLKAGNDIPGCRVEKSNTSLRIK